MNYTAISTDDQGNYNYTFTAPASYGIYEIKVNATYDNIPGEQRQILTVYAEPTINSNYTSPIYPKYNDNVTFIHMSN